MELFVFMLLLPAPVPKVSGRPSGRQWALLGGLAHPGKGHRSDAKKLDELVLA